MSEIVCYLLVYFGIGMGCFTFMQVNEFTMEKRAARITALLFWPFLTILLVFYITVISDEDFKDG